MPTPSRDLRLSASGRRTIKAFALLFSSVATIGISISAQAAPIDFGDLVFKAAAPQSAWETGGLGAASGSKQLVLNIDEADTIDLLLDEVERKEWKDANLEYITVNGEANRLSAEYDKVQANYDECVALEGTAACAPKVTNLNQAREQRDLAKKSSEELLAERDKIERYNKVGAEIDFSAKGAVGIELSYSASAGAVDPVMTFSASVDAPIEVNAGETFKIGTSGSLDNGMLSATSPGVSAALNQIANIDLEVGGRACGGAIFACTTVGSTGFSVDLDAELVEINQSEISFFQGYIDKIAPGIGSVKVPLADVSATASILAGTPPGIGITVNGKSGELISVKSSPLALGQNLATTSISLPTASFPGRFLAGSNKITGTAEETIVSSKVDVDTLFPLAITGGSVSVGPASVSIDFMDISAGPTLNILQNLELASDLMVNLEFDKTVEVYYEDRKEWQDVTSYFGNWDSLPDMKLYEDTLFTPTFSTNAMLTSVLGLELGFEATIGFFAGGISITGLSASFGPLIEKTFGGGLDFTYIDIFNKTFEVQGFNEIQANPFLIRAATMTGGSGTQNPGPQNPNPQNPNGNGPTAPVPLPAGMVLMFTGLASFGAVRHLSRKRKTALQG